MTPCFEMQFEMPPTSNKLYIKGRILTKEARQYAEAFAMAARTKLPTLLQLDPEGIYRVEIILVFDQLENKNWRIRDKLPPSKRPKNRYKKIDVTNRFKLLEDCVRDALDIDDCQTFHFSGIKFQDPGHERVIVRVFAANPEEYGLRKAR